MHSVDQLNVHNGAVGEVDDASSLSETEEDNAK